MTITLYIANTNRDFPRHDHFCAKREVVSLDAAQICLWAYAKVHKPRWCKFYEPDPSDPSKRRAVTNFDIIEKNSSVPSEIAGAVDDEIERLIEGWIESIRSDDFSEVF